VKPSAPTWTPEVDLSQHEHQYSASISPLEVAARGGGQLPISKAGLIRGNVLTRADRFTTEAVTAQIWQPELGAIDTSELRDTAVAAEKGPDSQLDSLSPKLATLVAFHPWKRATTVVSKAERGPSSEHGRMDGSAGGLPWGASGAWTRTTIRDGTASPSFRFLLRRLGCSVAR
jgi:hypothetical protein